MDAILAWPTDTCEGCGADLREQRPKDSEKSNDSSGRLKWTDFCGKCGYGHFVGDRTLPKPNEEELARRAGAPIIDNTPLKGLEDFDPEHQVTPGEVAQGEPSLIPPDKRGEKLAAMTGLEGQLEQQETEPPAEEKPEPGAIRSPGTGEYFCTKCASNHKEASGIGKRHLKNREA